MSRRKKYCEMTVWLLLKLIQKQPPEAFCTKPVLSKTLQYLQDEQVLKSLFYSGYCDIFKIPILKNICEPLLLKMCSWNWKKCKNLASLAKWLSHRLRIKWFWVRVQYFPKTVSQWEFDYGLFTNLPRIIVACDFSPSSFKLRRGVLPLLAKYASLKTTCHNKLKFFLRTELLEILPLAKHVRSVTATLMFIVQIIEWHLNVSATLTL